MENETTNNTDQPNEINMVLAAGTPTPNLSADGVRRSSLTEAEINHQIEMDEDEGWGDDDEDDVFLGYECMGCGHVQGHEQEFRCDKCTGYDLEPWYG